MPNQKKLMKHALELQAELAASGRKPKIKLTQGERAKLEQNVNLKIDAKKPLTSGSKASRIAQLERDIALSAGSKNPTIQRLHTTLKAELAQLKEE